MKTQEISKVKIKEGTSNPWATSSTSEYKIILWSSLTEESDIEEYIKENYIRSNVQAPIGRSIKSIDINPIPKTSMAPSTREMLEIECTFSETIYYN